MSSSFITYRGVIYPWQCDHMGHMNVMWYTGKFDEASWQFLGNMGLTRAVLRSSKRGLAAVQQNITYKRELQAGDIVTVRSRLFDIKRKTIRLFHEMINDETGYVAAFAIVTGVHMDMVTRKSIPLPQEVLDRADQMVCNDDWVLSDPRLFKDELPFVSALA